MTRRRIAAVFGIGLLVLSIAAPSALAASNPTVAVGESTTSVGGQTQVDVSLSEAPQGVSGFEVTVVVENGDVAAVQSGAAADAFTTTTEPTIDENDTQITIEAADTGHNVEAGTTSISLATLTLAGTADGETNLTVASVDVDDDEGRKLHVARTQGRLTVESGASGNDDTAAGSSGGANEPTSSGTAADSSAESDESDGGSDGNVIDIGPIPEDDDEDATTTTTDSSTTTSTSTDTGESESSPGETPTSTTRPDDARADTGDAGPEQEQSSSSAPETPDESSSEDSSADEPVTEEEAGSIETSNDDTAEDTEQSSGAATDESDESGDAKQSSLASVVFFGVLVTVVGGVGLIFLLVRE